MKKKNLILILAGISLMTACKTEPEHESIETAPIEFKKEGELYITKPQGDTIQQLDIEIADNSYEQETGLMYRKEMEEDRGMLFVYDKAAMHNFYMKNTYIPLDIIFFGSDSTAVSYKENAQPMDESLIPSGKPAQFILEINAGLVEKWNIELGDKIDFKRNQ